MFVVVEYVLEVGVCAFDFCDLFDPDAFVGEDGDGIDYAGCYAREEKELDGEDQALFFVGFADVDVGHLFDDLLVLEHEGVVGASGFELDDVPDDEKEAEEQH